MPFTVGDIDKHKLGLDAKQKRTWIAIANSVLSKCIADGGTDETCAPRAIIQANGAVGSKTMTKKDGQDDAAKAESLDEQIQSIREAFRQAFDKPQREIAPDPPPDFWVREVFDDHVIVRGGSEFWRVPYTMDADDNATFADRDDWIEVEQEFVEKMLGETLIAYGGAIKAAAGGKIGGYLVRFSDQDAPDLEGEYFTKDTDFDLVDGERTTLYYHHGQDPTLGKSVIGEGALKLDDVGVWLDGQLDMRDRYVTALANRLAQDEAASKSHFGLSSGTAPHLVVREPMEKAVWLKRWPLRLDASITPTPAEPTTRVVTLKMYTEQATPGFEIKALVPEDTSKEGVSADAITEPAKPTPQAAPIVAPKPKQKSATGGGKVSLQVFPIREKHYVFEVDGDGNRGEPFGSYDTVKEANEFIIAEQQPAWIKLFAKMQAENIANMQKMSDASDARIEKMVAAMGATLAADGKGYSFSGQPTASPKTFVDFIKAVLSGDKVTLKDMGSSYVEYESEYSDGTKVLGDQTGAEGGFTVPDQFLNQIIKVDPEREIVWPRADKVRMAHRTLQVPGLSTAGSTAGQTNMIPGMVGHWTETGTLKTEVEMTFTQIELVAWEYSGWIPIKDALLQDSALSIEGIVRNTMRDAVMFYRDEVFLDGTGAGQPQGVVTANGTLARPRNTAGAIDYLDLVDMKGHLLPSSWNSAMWVFHISAYESLRTMQDPAGNYIWVDNARDGEASRILGLPFVFTEKTPMLGLRGDVILADWKWYLIGNKQELSIASSDHVRFLHNQRVIKFVMRVAGQEKLPAPIFLKDGQTEVSPFVVLSQAGTT